MSARDKIAEILATSDHLDIEDYADRILAALPDMIAPLVFEEGRNNYWGSKRHDYQIAWCLTDTWRVRLGGKVVCRQIKGYDKAVTWANAHHRAAIMAAFNGGTKP
jgi:hypothetical protein